MPVHGLIYRDASLEIQKGIRDRLNVTMNPQSGGPIIVYDTVPENTEFPYITVGDQETSANFSTKGKSGQDVMVSVDIWSRYAGRAESGRLASEVTQRITESPISVSGFEVVSVDRISSVHIEEADGTHHWSVRFRFKVSDLVSVN